MGDSRNKRTIPNIEIRRSRRKTLAIEVASADRIIVRAPAAMGRHTIDHFLNARTDWIDCARTRLAEREAASGAAPTDRELEVMRARAADDLPIRVRHWSSVLGVEPARIQIRNQRSRWGSCSANGTLSLNLQLMRLPEWVRDYVVVHELGHLVHPNHGADFWALVARTFPRYREARAQLREVVLFR